MTKTDTIRALHSLMAKAKRLPNIYKGKAKHVKEVAATIQAVQKHKLSEKNQGLLLRARREEYARLVQSKELR